MKVFFDTNVLVAATVRSHPHHSQARPALVNAIRGQDAGCMSAHSITETYAVLTRLPLQPRIHPAEAMQIIRENLLPHLEAITLGKGDFEDALQTAASGGWSGARIYDALILRSAMRSGADRIYTFNLDDFRRLAPELEQKICAPG